MAQIKWTPVQMNGTYRNSNKTVAGNYQSLSDNLITRPEKRLELLNVYDEMDTTPEITRALDIIAEDISSADVDNKKTFELNFPESAKPKKGQTSTLEGGIKNWEKICRLEYMFFDIIREVIKYGMVIFLKNSKPKNGEYRWKKIQARQIIGHKHSEEDENNVTHYLIDFGSKTVNGCCTKDVRAVPIKDLFILKLGDTPYGKSILDSVYKVWKQQTLIENAVIIYRIVRAPERRVFFIDLGDIAGKRGEAELNRIKTQMYQKKLSRNGSLDSVYDPMNIQEDYFIGTNSEGRGNRIETLPGASNLGEIGDLLRFDKKLAMALRIPASYMSVGDDKQTWNDGKVGLSLMEELRYVGYIRRLQRILAVPLFVDFKEYMVIIGIDVPEDLEFSISQTQNFSIYKENEINQVLLAAYNTADVIPSLSKRFSLQKYLNLSDGELELNEQLKIEELGLVYSKLTKEQVWNVVYGDGSLVGIGDDPTEEEPEDKITKIAKIISPE